MLRISKKSFDYEKISEFFEKSDYNPEEIKTREEAIEKIKAGRTYIKALNRMVEKLIDENKKNKRYRELFNESQRIGKVGAWEIATNIIDMRCSRGFFTVHEIEQSHKTFTFPDYTELIHPDDRLRVITTITKAVEMQKRFRIEYKIRLGDSSNKYVYTEGETKYNKKGIPTGIFGVTQDITDRKLVEESLRKSESLYKLLFNGSYNPIFVRYIEKDKITETLLEVNAAMLNMFEYTRDEVHHVCMEDLFAPEERLALPQKETALREKGSDFFEAELITKSGRKISCEVYSQIVDIQGHLTAYYTIRDISRRKKAEISLRKSEASLESIIRHTNSIVFVVDANRVLTLAEGRGLELLKIKRSEIVGKKIPDIIYHTKELLEAIDKTLNGNTVTTTVIFQNGAWEMHLAPIYDDNSKIIGAAGIANDITERNRSEANLRESESRFRALSENALLGIYVFSMPTFSYVNPTFAAILGMAPEDIINKLSPFDLAHPEDKEIVYQAAQSLMAGATDSGNYLFRAIHRDGRTLFIEIMGKRTEVNGEFAIVGTIQDVTSTVRAEKLKIIQRDLLLQLSRTSDIRTALETVTESFLRLDEIDVVSFYLFDKESGNLVLQAHKGISQAFAAATTEYSANSYHAGFFYKPKPTYSLYEKIAKLMDEVRSSEKLRAFGLIPIVFNSQPLGGLVVASKANDEFSSDIRTLMEGIADSLGGIFTRINAQRELAENDAFIRSVTSAIPEVIYIYDLRLCKNVFTNRELLSLVGYTEEEVEQESPGFVETLFHSDDIRSVSGRLNRFDQLEEGEMIELEFRMMGKDKHYHWLQIREIVFKRDSEGNPLQILGSAANITENKLVEEQIHLLNVELENRVVERTHQIESANQKLEQEIIERHRIEASLRESEEKHRAVVENATDGILVVQEKTIKFLNYQAAEILNLNYEKCKTGEIDWFLLPDDLKELFIKPEVAENRGRTNIYSQQLLIVDSMNRKKWLECRFVSIKWQGSSAVLSFMNDISQRMTYEREIRESREQMKIMINATHDIIFLADTEGAISTCNNSLAQVLDLDLEKIIGRNVFSLLPDDVSSKRKRFFMDAVNSKRIISWVDESLGRFWDSIVYPIIEKNGSIKQVAVFSTDITERKRAELAIRESEERFRTLADIAPVLIWMAGVDKSCIYFNKYWLDFTGRSFDQEFGFGWTDGVHPDDFEICMADFDAAYKSRSILQHEFRLRAYDGEYRWILDTAKPRVTKDGTFVGYIGSCIDITERKLAEDNITRANERFTTVLESLDAWVYVADMQTHELIYVSKVIRDELGDVTGELCWKALKYDTYDVCSYCTNQHLLDESGEPKGVYVWEYYDKFRKKWLQCHDRAIRWTDGRLVKLEIATDITGLKEAELKVHRALEQEKELSNLKTRFISMVSHEYRTPLTVILSSAEILEDFDRSTDIESYAKYIEKIKASVERMTQLLEDMLVYGRIDSGKQHLNLKKISIVPLVKGIAEEMLQIDKNKHLIHIESNIEDVRYVTDERLLHQVITNLVSNALKYSPEGETVLLRIEFNEDMLSISVKDNGIGISADDLAKLFEPFHRGQNVENIQGTGFGLAIVQRTLELLGGTIEVNSELGNGSEFIVKL